MRLFEKILNFFKMTRNVFEDNNEPYIITDESKSCYVIKSRNGYSVEVRLDDIYMYFKYDKGNFCIKRQISENNLESIESFVKSSRVFHLEKSSFNDFIHRFYRNTFSALRLMSVNKNPFIVFESVSYFEAKIVTRLFLDGIYKVNLKYKKYTYNNENFYFAHGYLIQEKSLKDFLFSTFSERERIVSYKLRKNTIDNDLNNFEKLAADVMKRIDIDKIKVLCFENENIVFPFKLNGSNVLLGISRNPEPMKKLESNKLLSIKKNIIEITNNEILTDNIDSKFHFVLYSFSNKKLLKQRFIADKDELMRMKIDIFTKVLKNVNIRLAYPAQEMLMDMLRLDILEPHESLTKESIDIYEMLQI